MNHIFSDIEFVYFDLDDTLWDFSANSPISLAHVYHHFNLGKYAPDYDTFRNLYINKNAELWNLYHYGKVDKDFLEVERFRYPLAMIGDPRAADIAFCAGVNSEYLRFLATLPTLVDGAEAVVKALCEAMIPLGILSNGFAGIQQQKLRSAGILQYFKHIVLSDDIGITKPLPGIFQAAEKIADTHSHNIIMIGDNYEADILGANMLGWKTIFFNRKNVVIPENIADYTITSLLELI